MNSKLFSIMHVSTKKNENDLPKNTHIYIYIKR